jgi:TolC family type I secretion outer membrane protein
MEYELIFIKWIALTCILIQVFFCHLAIGSVDTRLNLSDCIETALKNEPNLRAARAELEADKAREKQAISGYLPKITASTGYSEAHQDGGAVGDTINKNYSTSLSLNQTIYDFGRTGNAYDSACLNTRSAELDEDRVKQDVILKVKQAYFDFLQSQRLVLLAKKTLEQSENHLKQAKAFYRAGTKPVFDVTRAEVEVNSQQLSLINANNRMIVSRMALNNAMGIDPERQIEIDDSLAMPQTIPTLEKVKAEALENRPDLRKAESDIASAAARIQAEKSNHLPVIALNGSYNWANGTSEMGIFEGDTRNSWNASIALTLPIYEGGLTSGKISEAKSNMQILKAKREVLRQTILIDVCQYYADMESAQVRIQVMESSLKKATENLDIAQGRYEEGVGPYIDVTDAQVSAVQAETDYVQSLYDFQLAAAMLLRAMGKGEQLQGMIE